MTSLEARKCGACPFVRQCEEKLQELEDTKQKITGLAVDDGVEKFVAPTFLEIFRDAGLLSDFEGSSRSTEEEIAIAFRKQAAVILENIDQQQDSMAMMANIATAACSGPLKMRASKAGTTVINTVCNNPLLPAGEQIEDVVVFRHRDTQ